MKKIYKLGLFIVLVILSCISYLVIRLGINEGPFYKPDIPRFQAEGNVIVKAIRKYEEVHARLPENRSEILADEGIPMDAKNLLVNSKWQYFKDDESPDDFILYRYTGHGGDVLRYMAKDENGTRKYRWEILNWK